MDTKVNKRFRRKWEKILNFAITQIVCKLPSEMGGGIDSMYTIFLMTKILVTMVTELFKLPWHCWTLEF